MPQFLHDHVAREADTREVAVVGLGYVGAPLAYELYRAGHSVIGYDIDPVRAQETEQHAGRIESVRTDAVFRATTRAAWLREADTFVIAVPTPTRDGSPDLSLVLRACEEVGASLKPGDLVVFESTVYPGVTRDHCRPVLEKQSNLVAGAEFGLAFSPERINPGDDEHRVTDVVKVVSGIDDASAAAAAALYASAIPAGIHIAPSLEVAELAKLLENTQRDVNIALMNEVNLLAQHLGLRFRDVLDACATKWNFGHYTPGLVGGHCI